MPQTLAHAHLIGLAQDAHHQPLYLYEGEGSDGEIVWVASTPDRTRSFYIHMSRGACFGALLRAVEHLEHCCAQKPHS